MCSTLTKQGATAALLPWILRPGMQLLLAAGCRAAVACAAAVPMLACPRWYLCSPAMVGAHSKPWHSSRQGEPAPCVWWALRYTATCSVSRQPPWRLPMLAAAAQAAACLARTAGAAWHGLPCSHAPLPRSLLVIHFAAQHWLMLRTCRFAGGWAGRLSPRSLCD